MRSNCSILCLNWGRCCGFLFRLHAHPLLQREGVFLQRAAPRVALLPVGLRQGGAAEILFPLYVLVRALRGHGRLVHVRH